MPVIDEQIAAVELSTTICTDVSRRYLACLAVLLLIVYLAGLTLVRIPSYERWGGSSFGPILDYAFQTAGQNADVLIFGDSSAIFALDPIEMSRELGLKVVNLPNTIGGLPVIGDMALKRYLASNRPPKMILFYFCAWDLDYAKAHGTRLFEGEEMLVRHGSWGQILQFAAHHPREVFYFPFRVYNELGPGTLLHLLHLSPTVPEVAAYRGHVANLLPYGPLLGDCKIPDQDLQEPRTASVQNLMARYSSRQTKTILYLAPVPSCQNVNELLASIGGNLRVAPPAAFPPGDFSADGYYAHLKPSAVGEATRLATGAVRAQLGGQ
jgi:hypothetical protein